MVTIGILATDTELMNEIQAQGQMDDFKCVLTDSKEQIDYLDGLIIQMETQAHLAKVVDWLIACKSNPKLFIWVFSEVELDYEQEILMQLGTNGIVSTRKNLFQLSFLIKNTFVRLESRNEQNASNASPVTFLNKVNQSIVINGEEKELTRKEFQLIYHLNKNRNTTVDYAELAQQLWPEQKYNDNYRLSNVMLHLREKLKDSEAIDIRTIRSKGYMLRVNA